jgi:hypothetical protein
MLTRSPRGFSKGIVPLLIALTLCISCTKSYDPGNLFSDRMALLTGQADSLNWVLSYVQVNNSIDTTSRGVLKIYRSDGTFTDNLGFTGYWTLYSRDSLIESTRSCVDPSAPFFTNHFHIDYLDKGRLQLNYSDTDKKIKLVYGTNK